MPKQRVHNYRRFRGERTASEQVRQQIDQLVELRTSTIEQMVILLEDCREIFAKMMERGTEDQVKNPSNPYISSALAKLAELNNRIKNALDVAKVL